MTDRYTELVKQAYEAQQAREGERYQSLTSDLARIDADLEALAAKREQAVAALRLSRISAARLTTTCLSRKSLTCRSTSTRGQIIRPAMSSPPPALTALMPKLTNPTKGLTHEEH